MPNDGAKKHYISGHTALDITTKSQW